ncbi:MAG: hypothetical protein K8L91_21125 [Anaerolineae bacterium]|nr:hypothetical protein [Anaerolineae bacterium]
MKLARRTTTPFLFLILVMGLLWMPHPPSFGQAPPTKAPHLAYGDTLTVNLPARVWLDVSQGDTFTVSITGGQMGMQTLQNTPTHELPLLSSKEGAGMVAYVYQVEPPGPYLWQISGSGTATLTLERGDTIDVDRGPIAIGDTVTGTASEGVADVYSIDLPPDTAMTVHLIGPCDVFQNLYLSGLWAANRLNLDDTEHVTQYYVIPAELAGTHQILVQCGTNEYTLSVVAGNDLWLDKGTLTTDAPISAISTPNYYDRYTLDMQQGELITVWIKLASDASFRMEAYDATGGYMWRGENKRTDEGYYRHYWANREGPYVLYIQTDVDYTLWTTTGIDVGDVQTVRIGESVVMSESIETWLVDVPNEAWVTLETQDLEGGGPVEVELVDGAGRSITSTVRFRDTDVYHLAFYLTGPGPYRVNRRAPVSGNFSVTVSEGEHLRLNRGEIEVGQRVEGTAEYDQTLHYTLSETPPGQMIVVTVGGVSSFSVTDAKGEFVEQVYTNYYTRTEPANQLIIYAAFQFDGLCPCSIDLLAEDPDYTLEVALAPEGAFPEAQPLILGEAVSVDMGEAWIVPYTFEATSDGDLTIRLDYDATQTDASALLIEVQANGEYYPFRLDYDETLTLTGYDFIEQHYRLDFPGEYTLRIRNLYGPYTLTVELQ